MELLDGTEFIKQLLVEQPGHLQKLVVGDKLIHNLPLHPSGLGERRGPDEKKDGEMVCVCV